VADPTNLHAIDEIKFQTSLGIEAVIVEDDKLQKAVDKALEQVDNQMSALTDDSDVDLESLKSPAARTSSTRRSTRRCRRRPDRALRQQGHAGCHPPRRFGYSLRAVREIYRVRLRMDGVLKEIAQPPVQLAQKLSARLKVMSRLDIAERRVPRTAASR